MIVPETLEVVELPTITHKEWDKMSEDMKKEKILKLIDNII